MIDSLRRWRDETGDTHALGAARVVLGLLLLEAAWRAGAELRRGYFGDAFHWPIVPEALVPSSHAYAAILVALGALAGLVVLGVAARPALFATAALSTYVLLCDRVQFHHNRWAMACYALLLSLSPCDGCYALAARRSGSRVGSPARSRGPSQVRSRVGPLWAARLAQVQVSIIYFASGGSKFFDPDWRDGRVLATRMALYGQNAIDAGVPARIVAWFGDPGVASGLAKLAIATELFLGVGLWLRRDRAFALWWGLWFHLTIEATSRVEGFTWLTLAMYGLFATPDVGSRRLTYDPASPFERIVARAVSRLDWLARFDIEAAPREAGAGGIAGAPARGIHGLVVVDRDGRARGGLEALAAIARATPLLFPSWVPLAALARGRTLLALARMPARPRGG